MSMENVDQVQSKCCTCRGAHSVDYGWCEVMRLENKIQKVRVERGMTYAAAVRVSREQNTKGQGVMTELCGKKGSSNIHSRSDQLHG